MSTSPLSNSTSAWASVFILTSLENRLNQNRVSACACQPVYLCLHPAFSPAPEDSLSALLLVCWIPLLLTHSRALSLHLFPLCHSSWAFSSLSDHSYHQNQFTASLKKKVPPLVAPSLGFPLQQNSLHCCLMRSFQFLSSTALIYYIDER